MRPESGQEGYGATIGRHCPVGQGPCQAGATLPPSRGSGLPEEGDAEGTQVHRLALLPATVRSRGDRLLFA